MEDYLNTAKELVDKLALEVVMLEPKDVPGLGIVLNRLDEVIGVFTQAGREAFAGLGKAIKSIGEKLVLGELPSPEQGLKQIEDGVSLFQEILRDADNVEAASEKISRFLSECCLSDAVCAPQRARPGATEHGECPAEKSPVWARGHATNYRTSIRSVGAPPPTMDKQGGAIPDIAQDRELVENFIMESLEHLGTIEVNVLALEQDPENLEVINAIFRPFHTIKGVSGFLNLSDINRLGHEVETLLDDARNQKLTVDEAITDVVLDAVDLMKAMINHLRKQLDTGIIEPADFGLETFLDRLRRIQVGEVEKVQTEAADIPAGDGTDTGSILVEKGVVTEQDVARALEKQAGPPPSDKKIGEILLEDEKATAREVAGALRDQKALREGAGVSEKGAESAHFVKVDTQKLDNMVDMVGELVIIRAMLGQDMSGLASRDKKLYTNLGQLRRITAEIQRISMSMRMIPIRQTFQKMIRLVRDLSRKSEKKATLEMIGEETEIDRNMVDEIYDPLVHMVRNSIDHGIEKPEVRKAMGKPEAGTVTLRAYHKGGNIVIEISDDGRGLDRDKIIARAIERNWA